MGVGILDELERVVQREPFSLPAEAALRLRGAVSRTFADSVVPASRYSDMGAVGVPDVDDEHVVAAARAVAAQAIVTMNGKDFPSEILARFGIEVLHPDDFLLDLVDLFPLRVVRIVEEQAKALRKPARTYEEVLDAIGRSAPETVARLREL